MNVYNLRINKALENVEKGLESLLSEKNQMKIEVERLNHENLKLKNLTESALHKLDQYILELEEIRRKHGNSNTGN